LDATKYLPSGGILHLNFTICAKCALRHNGSKCQDTIETNVTIPNLTITNDTTDDTIETTTSTTAAPDTDNQDATNVVEGDSSEVDESSSNTMNNEPERLINL
jgi:hypothetical protein